MDSSAVQAFGMEITILLFFFHVEIEVSRWPKPRNIALVYAEDQFIPA